MSFHQHTSASPPAKERRRARLLLLAYACVPGQGSECGVGWNRAIQAGRFADTWVICEGSECEAAIRRYITECGPVSGVKFVFVHLSRFEARLQKTPGFYYLGYYLWHRRAFAVARKLHQEIDFDLAHQVNMVGYREPGFLWQLPVPFVWGPVGGTQNFPFRFLRILRPRDAAKEFVRGVVNTLQLRFSRRVRLAARRASALLAANSTNERDLRAAFGKEVEQMLETGVSITALPRSEQATAGGPLRILWSGQIEPHKALSLLIDALALLPNDATWQARVLGAGSLRRFCERQAQRLNVHDRIEWLGWRRRTEAIDEYSRADVFVFTSLRDTSGNVVLEAMEQGVPIICLDHQGVADMVTPQCGIKLSVSSPGQVAKDLASALHKLAQDPELRRRLGEGARQRAEYYLWPRQGERMADIYRRVLDLVGSDAELREQSDYISSQQLDECEVFA